MGVRVSGQRYSGRKTAADTANCAQVIQQADHILFVRLNSGTVLTAQGCSEAQDSSHRPVPPHLRSTVVVWVAVVVSMGFVGRVVAILIGSLM